jgi:hypothetical protein
VANQTVQFPDLLYWASNAFHAGDAVIDRMPAIIILFWIRIFAIALFGTITTSFAPFLRCVTANSFELPCLPLRPPK